MAFHSNKLRGTRSQGSRSRRAANDWRKLAGPEDACRECGGAGEQNAHACLRCGGTGREEGARA